MPGGSRPLATAAPSPRAAPRPGTAAAVRSAPRRRRRGGEPLPSVIPGLAGGRPAAVPQAASPPLPAGETSSPSLSSPESESMLRVPAGRRDRGWPPLSGEPGAGDRQRETSGACCLLLSSQPGRWVGATTCSHLAQCHWLPRGRGDGRAPARGGGSGGAAESRAPLAACYATSEPPVPPWPRRCGRGLGPAAASGTWSGAAPRHPGGCGLPFVGSGSAPEAELRSDGPSHGPSLLVGIAPTFSHCFLSSQLPSLNLFSLQSVIRAVEASRYIALSKCPGEYRSEFWSCQFAVACWQRLVKAMLGDHFEL